MREPWFSLIAISEISNTIKHIGLDILIRPESLDLENGYISKVHWHKDDS